MEVGLRVVRGPDWEWSNQDDGEGHVGTVVEIGRPGSLTTPDKTVVVQWDSGSRTNYRVGYQGFCDLRVYDNAPIGVRHPNIVCNGCDKNGIAGMRWKCLNCSNYDLCTSCYMADKHDGGHQFSRYETNRSTGLEMPRRTSKSLVKIQARGIFVGARVVRGYDWDWGNQDGGEGKVGKVMDIRGWDNESRRSVANVMWATGSTNVYRLGHKGKVDVKYVIDAPGGHYYRDELPVLGQSSGQDEQSSHNRPDSGRHPAVGLSSATSSRKAGASHFSVGDKVKVLVESENELKCMQEGHGGWNPRMAQFIGLIGSVHRVTDRGDIRVQFENCHNRWTFNTDALCKLNSYSMGDLVKIIEDGVRVRELQKSHGEWIDMMKSALGKVGKVVKVYTDGDLRVNVDGQTWTFNPLCITLLDQKKAAAAGGGVVPVGSGGGGAASDPGPTNVDAQMLNIVADDRERERDRSSRDNNDQRWQLDNNEEPGIPGHRPANAPSQQQPSNPNRGTTSSSSSSSNSATISATSISKSYSPNDRLRYLESKIAEIEEANSCTICMERLKNVIFLCGHGACVNCAQSLKICHMCRETITKKINIY